MLEIVGLLAPYVAETCRFFQPILGIYIIYIHIFG